MEIVSLDLTFESSRLEKVRHVRKHDEVEDVQIPVETGRRSAQGLEP